MKKWLCSSFAAIVVMLGIALMLVIVGCSAKTTEENSSYADDLHFDNKYYINHWEFTITDPSKIKKVGTTEQSRRLGKGDAVYEIEGYPDHSFIAVKDKESLNGYSV